MIRIPTEGCARPEGGCEAPAFGGGADAARRGRADCALADSVQETKVF